MKFRVYTSKSLFHDPPVHRYTILLTTSMLAVASCEQKPPEPERAPAKAEPSKYTGPELPGSRPASPHGENAHAANPHAGNPHGADPHAGLGSAAAGSEKVGVTWKDPDGWKRVEPTSRMRKASWTIPRADGDPEDAELHLFYFGPKYGGGVDANVQRWLEQFPETPPAQAKRSEREVRGLKQTLVEIDEGTFLAGAPMGAKTSKKAFGLLGAIVETPSGSYFFKMTGPAKTVKGARDGFIALLDSIEVAP